MKPLLAFLISIGCIVGCSTKKVALPIDVASYFGLANIQDQPRDCKISNEQILPGEYRICFHFKENYPAIETYSKISSKLQEMGFALCKGSNCKADGKWASFNRNSKDGKISYVNSVNYEFRKTNKADYPESYFLILEYETDRDAQISGLKGEVGFCYFAHDLRATSQQKDK